MILLVKSGLEMEVKLVLVQLRFLEGLKLAMAFNAKNQHHNQNLATSYSVIYLKAKLLARIVRITVILPDSNLVLLNVWQNLVVH